MADEVVKIAHPDGRTGTVPAANLKEAEKLGWHPETATETATANRGSLLESGARGAAVGLAGGVLAPGKLVSGLGSAALGVQDPLAKLSGRQVVQDLSAIGAHLTGGESEVAAREAREAMQSDVVANPWATGAGELAGNLVGAGGLAGGARGAGSLAARGLAGVGLGARAARVGGALAGAAVEGAGLGANAASEGAWLKNETATAEQTLAGVGMGALFGAGTAGLLAGGGAGLSRLLRRAPTGAAAEGIEGAAARMETDAALAADEGGAAERAVTAAPEKPLPAPVEEASGSSAGRKAREWLNGAGDEAMVDAIARGNKPSLKRLGGGEAPTGEAKRATGALLHEMGIGGVGKSEAAMLETAESRLSEMGTRIGKAVQAADARVLSEEAGMHAPQSIESLFPKIEALKTKLAGEGMLAEDRAIPAWLEDQTEYLRRKASTGELLPSELQKFRIEVDSRLGKWAKAEPGPKGDAARELRRVLESHLEEEIAKAGPDVLQDYQRAKKLYAAANWATDTLAERVEIRNGANRLASPSDYAAGIGALAAGAHAPAAFALGLGNKLLRERGYSTLAVLAKKIAGDAVDVAAAPAQAVRTARNVQSLVAHTEQRMGEGIGRFLGGSGEGAAAPLGAGRGARASTAVALRSNNLAEAQRAYRDHAREVQTVAAVPEVAASRLAGITGQELPTVAPGLHAAMTQVAARGAQYLASTMPAPPSDPDSITPQLDEAPPVSSADLHQYADRVEGVENPLSLIDDLQHGKASPDKVDAIKAVYPTLFDRMREHVFSQLAERTTPVPYHQRLLLDLVLDGNGSLEPSLKPSSLAIMRMANEAVAKSAAPPSASGKVPKIAGMFSTRTAQITAPRGA